MQEWIHTLIINRLTRKAMFLMYKIWKESIKYFDVVIYINIYYEDISEVIYRYEINKRIFCVVGRRKIVFNRRATCHVFVIFETTQQLISCHCSYQTNSDSPFNSLLLPFYPLDFCYVKDEWVGEKVIKYFWLFHSIFYPKNIFVSP